MNGQEIANKIAGLIGSNVSPSQVSHARTYFGTCTDDDLVAKFVAYYKQYGKKPRVPNGLRKADVDTNVSSDAVIKLKQSVLRMGRKLETIGSLAQGVLDVCGYYDYFDEPKNPGQSYKRMNVAIAAIREICGPSIVEGGAE